jgi:hypothetical protein
VSIDFAELFAFCDLHVSRARESVYERLMDTSILGPGPRYYDRQGFPIPTVDGVEPTLVWAQMKSDAEYSRVARDDFPDGSRLSTVWLGLDHGFGGRPLFFETMYFSGEGEIVVMPSGAEVEGRPSLEFPDPLGEQDETTTQLRYHSEEEALALHHEIARRIRKRWEV